MNDLFIYIQNRMREMGYTAYHFEPYFIQENVSEKTIYAHNEYYYLISDTVPPDLVILSDTNIFTDAAFFSSFNFNNYQEFSGTIEIIQSGAPMELEFIRVVPA